MKAKERKMCEFMIEAVHQLQVAIRICSYSDGFRVLLHCQV